MMERKTETNLLFIYGTLLPVFDNSWRDWLKNNAEPITEGYMPGLLYLISDYPGALYFPEVSSKVMGLVVRMENIDYVLHKLDQYEEADERYGEFAEFKREIVDIYGFDGIVRKCWVYLYNRNVSDKKLLISGDYITYSFSNF
jgi:gamma-glutamylcyclotransferase (GGCT)/AIG2-like uncharacterized protein YtfP